MRRLPAALIPHSATLVATAVLSVFLSACGGYNAKIKALNRSVGGGAYAEAVQQANELLEVEETTQQPAEVGGDDSLLLLERAGLLYALGEHEQSSADFQLADDVLEVLALSDDTGGNIGLFLFSDDSKTYVGSPVEKLMLNTMNALNYLARGDLSGARVEVRRFAAMADFLREDMGDDYIDNALSRYIAGFVYEMSGSADEALRYYAEALESKPSQALVEPIRRLSAISGYRTPAVRELLDQYEGQAAPGYSSEDGTVLVVVSLGRVPHRVPERMPIGLALSIVGAAHRSHALTSKQRADADMLIARGLLTWLSMPKLVATSSRYQNATVTVGGELVPSDTVLNLGELSTAWFQSVKPTLVAASLVRAIARLLAGYAVQKGTKAAGSTSGVAALLGLALQGALAAADTPDTRSWNTLPNRYLIARSKLPAGKHSLTVRVGGEGSPIVRQASIDLNAGGFVVVPVTVLH